MDLNKKISKCKNLRISEFDQGISTFAKILINRKNKDTLKSFRPDRIMKWGSSSCRAASTDIPDPLLPLLPIVHCFWQVLRATSRMLTELLYVGLSWLPCFCSAMWGGSIGEHHLGACHCYFYLKLKGVEW